MFQINIGTPSFPVPILFPKISVVFRGLVVVSFITLLFSVKNGILYEIVMLLVYNGKTLNKKYRIFDYNRTIKVILHLRTPIF